MEYTFKVDRFEFVVKTEKDSNGIHTNCHIPAYDIYFCARDIDMIERKSKAMVKMWTNFYNIR